MTRWTSPVIPWEAADDEVRPLLESAWAQGDLSYKLTPSQLSVYEQYRKWEASPMDLGDRVFCADISRRWGKSNLMLTVKIEDCIRHPGWRIPYIAPINKDVLNITMPLIRDILQDCPPDLRPTWMESKQRFTWKNGSQLELIGLDKNPDGARGTGIDGAGLDECGFFDKLDYLMNSILFPQMLGRPWARIFAGSTPPVSPSHYWSERMIPAAIARKSHALRTLLDADQYLDEEKQAFIAEAGGIKNTTCRREYFAEHIAEETMAIIPEFRLKEEQIVKRIDPPKWRDCYVSLDPGWKDLSAALFGYWHFELATLVIEDEMAAPRQNSRAIADCIHQMEKHLWGKITRNANGRELPQPYLRISDNDLRLIADLRDEHGLNFTPTQKDNLDQQVNSLRNAIAAEKVLIHPRCSRLIKSLRNAVWKNEARKDFAKGGEELGHYDLVAALIYLWRNVNRHRNPWPQGNRYVAGFVLPGEKGLPRSKRGNWRSPGTFQTKWAFKKR